MSAADYVWTAMLSCIVIYALGSEIDELKQSIKALEDHSEAKGRKAANEIKEQA